MKTNVLPHGTYEIPYNSWTLSCKYIRLSELHQSSVVVLQNYNKAIVVVSGKRTKRLLNNEEIVQRRTRKKIKERYQSMMTGSLKALMECLPTP